MLGKCTFIALVFWFDHPGGVWVSPSGQGQISEHLLESFSAVYVMEKVWKGVSSAYFQFQNATHCSVHWAYENRVVDCLV